MVTRKEGYAAKLLDPRWQKKRLEILQRDEWTCQECYSTEKTLHVHHVAYSPFGEEPWEIDNVLLVTLCADCHEVEGQDAKERLYWLVLSLAEIGVRTATDYIVLMSAAEKALVRVVGGGPLIDGYATVEQNAKALAMAVESFPGHIACWRKHEQEEARGRAG